MILPLSVNGVCCLWQARYWTHRVQSRFAITRGSLTICIYLLGLSLRRVIGKASLNDVFLSVNPLIHDKTYVPDIPNKPLFRQVFLYNDVNCAVNRHSCLLSMTREEFGHALRMVSLLDIWWLILSVNPLNHDRMCLPDITIDFDFSSREMWAQRGRSRSLVSIWW